LLEIKTKKLHLRNTWTIARNSSDYKENVFVKIERYGITGIGEAAPNVRYGENTELTIQKIRQAEKILENFDWFHFADIKKALDEEDKEKPHVEDTTDVLLNSVEGEEIYAILRPEKVKSAAVANMFNAFGKEGGFDKILQRMAD